MSGITLLSAQGISLSHNERVLLDQASLAIQDGDRIGLVGRNGAGKSTLLKILTGEIIPDAGDVTKMRDLVVGYLPQQYELPPDHTVEEVVRSGADHILDALKEFESLGHDSRRHDELEQRIQRLDGWNLDQRISNALNELHCPAPDRKVGGLSGGEKRRVALARVLVRRPDLLILDEPTNHLDTDSVEWVIDFVREFSGALLVVTHDRHFLNEIAAGIVELRNGQFDRYSGNYTEYLVERAERLASEELVEHKRQMFLRRELAWAIRQPKAQTTKSKSRMDRFEAVAGADAAGPEVDMELVIPPPPPLGNRIVDLIKLGMALGGKQLFSNLEFNFRAADRIGITGRNGLGKTTLLRLILGQITPDTGEVRTGTLTRFNYVDQNRRQLDDEKTVLEEVSDGTEFVKWGDHRLSLRGYLKRFLFTDDRITTRVKYLSGGERSRLLLARMLKQGGNFLILDEPTNDLDLVTLRVLEEALIGFPGCVLVVSHDRYFLNRICNGILAFEGDGRVRHHVGNFDSYWEKYRTAPPVKKGASKSVPAPAAPAPQSVPTQARKRKRSLKEQQEFESMEARIMETEEKVQELEALLASPDFHRLRGTETPKITTDLATARSEVVRLYARWTELENMGS